MNNPARFIPSPRLRAYFYGVMVAAAALAVIYGIVTPEQAGGWLVLGGAALGLSNGLALANTPRKEAPPNG
jgi:hypothetical protein